VDVAAQPVELGTDDRGLGLARSLDRRVQLRPVIVSAALGLGEGIDQVERLGLGKPGDRRALRLEAEPGSSERAGRRSHRLRRQARLDEAGRSLHDHGRAIVVMLPPRGPLCRPRA
jgi:hypothetical protein